MHAVLKTALDALVKEVAHFDAASAEVHPRGASHCWSTSQILRHLTLSMDEARVELETRLAKRRVARNAHRTRTEWALQLMVLTVGSMPNGIPAPESTVPAADEECVGAAELIKRLEIAVEQMDQTLDQARRLFGMERVGSHFLLGPLRVDQWRRYQVVHMRHHQKQIHAIRVELSRAVQYRSTMARA